MSNVEGLIIHNQQQKLYNNFIAGQWSPPKKLRYFPSDWSMKKNEIERKLPRSCSVDVGDALSSANKSVSQWGKMTSTERCLRIREISKTLLDEIHELVNNETYSKNINAEKLELELEQTLQFYSTQRIMIPTLLFQSGGQQRRLKAGAVVKQITPVCMGLNDYLARVFTILSGGHCVVSCILLKPDYQMPLSLLRFIKIAGKNLPEGVFNVVFGLAAEAGSTLVYSTQAVTAFHIGTQTPAFVAANSSHRVLH